MARPPFKPTAEQRKTVRTLAGYGINQNYIAKEVGLGSKHTLIKHFRDELDDGKDKADALVMESMFNQCRRGNATLIIWWTKNRMGWKDKIDHEITGKDGNPIEHAVKIYIPHNGRD